MALGGPAWSLQWMPRDAASPRPLPGPVAPSSLTVCKMAALLGWLHSSPARRSSSSAASSGLSLPPLAPCATFRSSCSWAPAPASVWSGVIPWKQAPRAASLQPRPHHPHWHSRAYSTSIIPLRPLRRRFGAVDLGHGPRYSFVLFLGWPPPSSPLYGAPPPPSGICRSPPVGLFPLPFGRVLPFRVASACDDGQGSSRLLRLAEFTPRSVSSISFPQIVFLREPRPQLPSPNRGSVSQRHLPNTYQYERREIQRGIVLPCPWAYQPRSHL